MAVSPLHCARETVAVYSDVDDTLQCSAQHRHAGVDVQFPKGTIYPGAVAFQLALSRGLLNKQALPVVLLSARPKVLKWILGIKKSHPIAQAFIDQDARFTERFNIGTELDANNELEIEENEGEDATNSASDDDDFYEYGDEYWDGSGEEPVVVVVKQASSYHQNDEEDHFSTHEFEGNTLCQQKNCSSPLDARDSSEDHEVGNSQEAQDAESSLERERSALRDSNAKSESGAENRVPTSYDDMEITEITENDDASVDTVSSSSSIAVESSFENKRSGDHNGSPIEPNAVVMGDMYNVCPWNNGLWGLVSTDDTEDDDYYAENGIDRSDELTVGSGGYLKEQGDVDDAYGLCPWLDAEGRPVIRNTGWRRRSRKALLQYFPLQPIMPLQPILQFFPLGMLMDAKTAGEESDFADLDEFGRGSNVDDEEVASNMGVDIKRNMYGNLYDFFHNTRSRYVAIGRTKLANVISGLAREEEQSPYIYEHRVEDQEDDQKLRRCVAFVGDSGQGDEIVGRALVGNPGSYEDPVVPPNIVNRIAHVFIHDVYAPSNEEFTAGFSPLPGLPRYVRFKSYAEAALVAFKSCRISLEGFYDVVDSIEQSEPYQMCSSKEAEEVDVADESDSADFEPCGRGAGDRCCERLKQGIVMARDVLDSPFSKVLTTGRCVGLTAFEGLLQDAAETYVNWLYLGRQICDELRTQLNGAGRHVREVARIMKEKSGLWAELQANISKS